MIGKQFYVSLTVIIILVINSPIQGVIIPSKSPDYDSGWKERNLDYVKLWLEFNSTDVENVGLYCFILWRIIHENRTYTWEVQEINKTSINITKNIWFWRVLIWCPYNFTCSIHFTLNTIGVNNPLEQIASTEPLNTSVTKNNCFVLLMNVFLSLKVELIIGFISGCLIMKKRGILRKNTQHMDIVN